MNRPMAIVAGVLAGLLGAAIWGALVYYTEYEFALVAWAIGGLVGVAVLTAAGQSSADLGLVAAIITAASICGGKYVAIQLILDEAMEQEVAWEEEIDEEVLIDSIASEIIAEAEGQGEELEWPEVDYDVDEEIKPEDMYPQGIWREAEDKWVAMNAEEREALKQEYIQSMKEFQDEMVGMFSSMAFKESFGLFDVLFFGLGVFTAFKIAGTEWE